MSTKQHRQSISIRFCIHCECSQASAQAFSCYGNSSTVRLRSRLGLSDELMWCRLSSTCRDYVSSLIKCFGNLRHIMTSSKLCFIKKNHWFLTITRIFWSIFVIFWPLETGMNTLPSRHEQCHFNFTVSHLLKLKIAQRPTAKQELLIFFVRIS